MKKKHFGIIGKPLSHSLSPELHNYWLKKYKIFGDYSLMEINLNEIKETIDQIRNNNLQGINVTTPYKQAVIPYLDLLIDDAKETLSVNTISLNEKGKVVGNNTDVYGLEQGFIQKLHGQNLEQKKVLILGAGGVTASVIYALFKNKFKNIYISNKTYEKAENIKKKFAFIEIVEWKDVEKAAQGMDIIINATSLGMKGGNNFNQEFKNLKTDLVYYDIIYNPAETIMIKELGKRNIQTYNGLEMFIYQGQRSFFLWNNINPESDKELEQKIISKLK